MALPDSFLEELHMKNDITEVISNYVNLKRHGRNMVGLCPFHAEKSPSFTVYTSTNSFYCFGCAAGGDVITFIRRIENLDYIDAVKFLAQRCSMEMPENNYDDGLSKLRSRIYEANREAARFFFRTLYSPIGAKGLTYFKNRALTDETIKHFGLGYAPDTGYALCDYLKNKGFKEHEIIQANLGYKSNRTGRLFDKFSDRVIFPLIDLRGNVVAFGGRTLNKTDKAKYVNTSDTPVFKKSSNIFALNFAKNTSNKTLIIAEGYMDVIALHQAGFENAIASMGTAFTQEQAQMLARYAEEIIVCFDSDGAGRKATARAIEILRNTGLNIKILTVPGNKDPDEFLRTNKDNGPAKFKLLIENCGNDIEYRLQEIKKTVDIESAEGRVNYLTQAAGLLAKIDNSIERDVYAGRISEEMNVSKDAINHQIQKYVKKHEKDNDKKRFRKFQGEALGHNDRINPQKMSNLRAARSEEMLIAFLMKHPDKANFVDSKIKADDFITDFNKRVFSSIMDRLLNGRSASVSDISGEFTVEENSRISKVINQECGSISAAEDYIDRILSEKESIYIKKLNNADDEDILKYIDSLKNTRK